jgi:hypothetical protein
MAFIIATGCVLCEVHTEGRDSSYTQDSEVQHKAEKAVKHGALNVIEQV